MSATPPARPTGRTPNGGPARIRRPNNSDPLVKRGPRRPPATQSQASLKKPNGVAFSTQPQPPSKPSSTLSGERKTPQPDARKPEMTAEEYKKYYDSLEPSGTYQVSTTKRALRESLRYHVARLATKDTVNIMDEKEFTRPVRLHRRDPRAPLAGMGNADGAIKSEDTSMADVDQDGNPIDDKERERREIARQEKEAQKEADLAQIAPAVHSAQSNSQKKPRNRFKKKIEPGYVDGTPERQAKSQLHYEEALPWHIEDFDNKNTWVGNYEAPMSSTYCALRPTTSGFQMIPLDKWYKFSSNNKFRTFTIDEAEKQMASKPTMSVWEKRDLEQRKGQMERQKALKFGRGLFLGKWDLEEDEGKSTAAKKEEGLDANALDFEEDQFADDEEAPVMEGDEEENKVLEARIKREQLQANVFDIKDEKDYDKEEAEEEKENRLKDTQGKKVKKALLKREKNYIYDSDSDNKYGLSDSDSEDSDEEKQKEDEEKKTDEKKASERDKVKLKESSKLPSGTSSRGTNTPSAKTQQFETLKKSNSSNKRPGSPNLSEASGTESTRKKQKKKHSSSQPTASSTPAPGSRAHSPGLPSSSAPMQRKSSIVRLTVDSEALNKVTSIPPKPSDSGHRSGAMSGSDTEMTGADMSDGGRRRIKLRVGGSPKDRTPAGSRASSPQPQATRRDSVAAIGSRAGSPANYSKSAQHVMTSHLLTIEAPVADQDLLEAIPKDGIAIATLFAAFRGRQLDKQRALRVLVQNAVIKTVDGKKVIYPKGYAG